MRLRSQARLIVLAFIAAAVGQVSAAAGTFSGPVGKIAFGGYGEIGVIDADGTGRLDLTDTFASEHEPAWNAAGTRLVFRDSESSLSTMNPNGTDYKPLASMGSFVGNPSWSADGSMIAFDHYIGGPGQENRIFVVSASGGTPTQLVDLYASDPTYSPDGTQIAYERYDATSGDRAIGVMNADGTNAVSITSGQSGNAGDYDPSWSPDGTKLAFTRNFQIWTMNANGSGTVQLTTGTRASNPTWSPDGAMIAFGRDNDIWVMDAAGGGVANITNTVGEEERAPDWGVVCTKNCSPPPPACLSGDAICGGDDSETLRGTSSADAIYAGGGNDTILAGGGDDDLWGDAGTDSVKGQGGSDFLRGGAGRDVLDGGTGADRFDGGPGRDKCIIDKRKERRRLKSCEVVRFRRAHS